MLYQPGDQVCPSDLPRRFLCRVEQVESFKLRDGLTQSSSWSRSRDHGLRGPG